MTDNELRDWMKRNLVVGYVGASITLALGLMWLVEFPAWWNVVAALPFLWIGRKWLHEVTEAHREWNPWESE